MRAGRGGGRRSGGGPRRGARAAACSGRRARQARTEQPFALLGPLLAGLLGTPEEISQVGIARPVGVFGVVLEPQHVVEALLGEPDDVVVLVLGAGDFTRLG